MCSAKNWSDNGLQWINEQKHVSILQTKHLKNLQWGWHLRLLPRQKISTKAGLERLFRDLNEWSNEVKMNLNVHISSTSVWKPQSVFCCCHSLHSSGLKDFWNPAAGIRSRSDTKASLSLTADEWWGLDFSSWCWEEVLLPVLITRILLHQVFIYYQL